MSHHAEDNKLYDPKKANLHAPLEDKDERECCRQTYNIKCAST